MPIELAPLQLAFDKANNNYSANIQQKITTEHDQIKSITLAYQNQRLIDGPLDKLNINHKLIQQLINQKKLNPNWGQNVLTAIEELN